MVKFWGTPNLWIQSEDTNCQWEKLAFPCLHVKATKEAKHTWLRLRHKSWIINHVSYFEAIFEFRHSIAILTFSPDTVSIRKEECSKFASFMVQLHVKYPQRVNWWPPGSINCTSSWAKKRELCFGKLREPRSHTKDKCTSWSFRGHFDMFVHLERPRPDTVCLVNTRGVWFHTLKGRWEAEIWLTM